MLLFFLFSFFIYSGCKKEKGPAVIFTTADGEMRINVELARTEEKMARGLMFRNHLPSGGGMLFIYQEDVQPAFWMKNTYLSLDIIFFSHDGLIVDMFTRLPPCPMDPCPSYRSQAWCRYALEVNAGFTAAYQIKKGDRVRFIDVHP